MPPTLTLTSFFGFFFRKCFNLYLFYFNFCHVAGDFCSSYKDAPLSPSVLIYWVSYCLNLSRDAEKCPFGERKGNALAKIGKSTNSAPPAQTENEKFSPGHGNVHGEFISPLFQFAFGLKFSFVSFGTYLPKYRKKTESFTLFWRFKIFRRDSGKHPSSPITQIRPLAF